MQPLVLWVVGYDDLVSQTNACDMHTIEAAETKLEFFRTLH